MSRLIPPAPEGVPAELTITLPADLGPWQDFQDVAVDVEIDEEYGDLVPTRTHDPADPWPDTADAAAAHYAACNSEPADPVRCPKCGGPDPFHDPACVVHPDLIQDHNEQEQR